MNKLFLLTILLFVSINSVFAEQNKINHILNHTPLYFGFYTSNPDYILYNNESIVDGDYNTHTTSGYDGFGLVYANSSNNSYILFNLTNQQYINTINFKYDMCSAQGVLTYVNMQYSIDNISWTEIYNHSFSACWEDTDAVFNISLEVNSNMQFIRSSIYSDNILDGTSVRYYEFQAYEFQAVSTIQYVSLKNWIMDIGNNAYINIPYIFNATNFSITNGQLHVNYNDSDLKFRTSTNKTLTDITFNKTSDTLSFTGAGVNGYLNVSATMQNASSNYTLWLDNFFNSYAISNIGKQVTFNYTGPWSSHSFVINTTTVQSIPSTNLRLSGNITPSGSTIIAEGLGYLTGGDYDFDHVFEAGQSYWINVSKSGYVSNHTRITFGLNDIIHNVTLIPTPPTTSNSPVITGWFNSYSGTSLYSPLPSGQLNTYTVTSYIGNITDFTWTLDNVVIINETNASYTTSLTGNNLRFIRVFGTGPEGEGNSNTVEWRMTVMKTLAAVPLIPLNQSAYTDSKLALSNLSLDQFITATMSQYTGVLSNYVYLFIWGIIFSMMWIRQRSITIPSTIGLILGGIIIAMLPEQYQFIAQFMIAMGGFALLYIMFGERR